TGVRTIERQRRNRPVSFIDGVGGGQACLRLFLSRGFSPRTPPPPPPPGPPLPRSGSVARFAIARSRLSSRRLASPKRLRREGGRVAHSLSPTLPVFIYRAR